MKRPNELPLCMAERAIKARKCAAANPSAVQFDTDFMPWAYDQDSGHWLSFEGRYSSKSPADKTAERQKHDDWFKLFTAEEAEAYAKDIAYQSVLRRAVLERDGYLCQLCGADGSGKLHVHHILKRVEGGTDHFDNLLTVCPKCHRAADTKLYNPEWVVRKVVS